MAEIIEWTDFRSRYHHNLEIARLTKAPTFFQKFLSAAQLLESGELVTNGKAGFVVKKVHAGTTIAAHTALYAALFPAINIALLPIAIILAVSQVALVPSLISRTATYFKSFSFRKHGIQPTHSIGNFVTYQGSKLFSGVNFAKKAINKLANPDRCYALKADPKHGLIRYYQMLATQIGGDKSPLFYLSENNNQEPEKQESSPTVQQTLPPPPVTQTAPPEKPPTTNPPLPDHPRRLILPKSVTTTPTSQASQHGQNFQS